VRADCDNLKNSKDNAMNVPVSDESESDDTRGSKSKKVVYVAFPETVKNVYDTSNSGTLKDGETFDDNSRESNDSQGLKVAYNGCVFMCVLLCLMDCISRVFSLHNFSLAWGRLPVLVRLENFVRKCGTTYDQIDHTPIKPEARILVVSPFQ